jgi:hypothetical protein
MLMQRLEGKDVATKRQHLERVYDREQGRVPMNSASSRLISLMLQLHFSTKIDQMLTALNGSRLPFAPDPPKHRSRSNQDN